MKKLLSLILLPLMVFSLTACNSNTSQSDDPQVSTAVTNEDNTPSQDNNQITFQELTVVDNEQCTIKITGIDADNMWGYTLETYLENKSSDKTYMFSVDSAAVNGVQSDPFFATEVSAGKKANVEISFSDTNLEENGITDFTDIELTFRVYDTDDWSADDVTKTTVHVYPYGEDKAVTFVRESQDTDNIVIDNENVTVIVTGYEPDEVFGYTVNLFLVNKTEANVMFSVDEASINGYMADPYYATTVAAGKCAFSSISWSDTTFADNGITDVEEIELLFRAYDAENYTANDFATQEVTLNP